MKNILDITKQLGVPNEFVIPYGWDKAKIDLAYRDTLNNKPDGKLVLVTAITPTKAGEGKTTTTIGLHDGMHKIGVQSLACLREPSLGPVWGVKGGAVGALKSTIVPSDDINLHFTGDFHALTATINLIASVIDNHIYQGNELNIDPDRITWTRALDINDRALRETTVMQGDKKGTPHKCEFTITVASELMTIFCVATDEDDFIKRVNNITCAYTYGNKPVLVGDLHMGDAVRKMMHNALNPNIVQTLEENPVLVHGGPFANISVGVNTINATKLALKLSPVVITEAGFGGDLGAEKFLDIKCQLAGIKPSCIVLVATVRALKLHGGVKFEDLEIENVEAAKAGIPNLAKHAENMASYGVPVVIALNRFPSDTDAELKAISDWCEAEGYQWSLNHAAIDGGEGAMDLATKVSNILNEEKANNYHPLYPINDEKFSIKDKIGLICKNIYGADGVEYTDEALKQIEDYEKRGYKGLPVCISKTPNSLTDDAKILGRPTGFNIHIREVRLYSGAGLIVPLSGSLLLMPGLNKYPRALDKEYLEKLGK
ncbi:MAG: formate--tetrahydrofolate ligase [Bacilli bacterium]|nr:formate--tetrahydrofolate ligase [Bacilli bacterium]